jgi:hypothetical protein
MDKNYTKWLERLLLKDCVRRWRERRAAERDRLDREWNAWASTPEGQAYITKYGTEDWESLH